MVRSLIAFITILCVTCMSFFSLSHFLISHQSEIEIRLYVFLVFGNDN